MGGAKMLFYLLMLLENEDDRALMEHYYEEYRKLMFKIAHDYLDDTQQDEDCVQETLIGIINSFQTFKGLNSEAQRKYISTICKRCAYRINEKQNKNETEVLDDNLDSEAINLYFSKNNSFNCSELAAVINCLDDKYREPIMMKYLEQYSTVEIAETLGISENLVYQRINRGKEKLCKMLVEVE